MCGLYSDQEASLATKFVAFTISGALALIPVSQALAATPVVVASQVCINSSYTECEQNPPNNATQIVELSQ
jgi:hypothetical protein